MGEDGGVDGVGLGELSGALGEVADLAGVDDDGGQAGGEQGADRGLLVGAGRFKDDAPGARDWTQATSCSMPSGVLPKRRLAPAGRAQASRKSLQTSTPIRMRLMGRTPEAHKGATRADGVPVRAGECGVCPQGLSEPRHADSGADPTYSRTEEVLAGYGLAPEWPRHPQPRLQWVTSG